MKQIMASMEGGSMGRYAWPASKLGKDEMRSLFKVSKMTGKPITILVREAVRKVYGVEGEEEPE